MKITIKDKVYSKNKDKFEFMLTYKMGEWETKTISFIKDKEEVNFFIIQLIIIKELSKCKYSTFYPNEFLVRNNNVNNHFEWLKKVNQEINHYYRYDNFVVYYYNKIGEKFNVEAIIDKKITSKIKEVNKMHKIGGVNKWHKATPIDYNHYHTDLEKTINECLILCEKLELEREVEISSQDKKVNPKTKIKI